MFTYYTAEILEPTKIYYTLIEPYEQMLNQKFCKRKQIFVDKPDKKENNILVVPLEPPEAHQGAEFKYWDHIQWGLDNGMKIFIDYSWEYVDCDNLEWHDKYFWRKHKQFLTDNNIKIISQSWAGSGDNNIHWDHSIHQLVHNVSIFEYNMRICHETENYDYRLAAYPAKEKKHLVNYIPGDIRKYPASLMLQSLFETLDNPDEDLFYSTIIGDYYSQWMMNWDSFEHLNNVICRWKEKKSKDLWLRTVKNIKNLHLHKPFEEKYDLDQSAMDTPKERRIPQGVYDSHFSIIAEVSWSAQFWSEKTFKHVIAEKPFIISAGRNSNEGLTQLGYELYDEVFDYTFNTDQEDAKEIMERSHWCIIDNVERLKDNREIFDSPTVKDKTRFNRDNLLRRTSIDSFRKELERLISA